jgi:hypothetical protein
MAKRRYIIEVEDPTQASSGAVATKVAIPLEDFVTRLGTRAVTVTVDEVPENEMHMTLEQAEDAIESVVTDVQNLMDSSTPLGYAEGLVALSNSISDLASWHSRYNSDTGKIETED